MNRKGAGREIDWQPVLLGFFVYACAALLAACLSTPTAAPAPPKTAEISGIVVDSSGAPVAGATVRIQASSHSTLTDQQGHFQLSASAAGIPPAGNPLTISAWKDLYYCARQEGVIPPASDVRLVLRLYQTDDNPAYAWVPPVGENSCYSCKPGLTQVWLDQDAHGKSAVNPIFLTMYNGTDVKGNPSPPTRFTQTRDYGRLPLPPDSTQPYFGPGYKLDYPVTDGNCATCHIPGAAIPDPYGVDPNQVKGIDRFGIHCDFCHKIAAVALDPSTQLPDPDRPGVLSMDIRRPFADDPERYQLFFGTFDDDNVPEEDTRLPLISQSQFCAPCHYGVFWDTLVYNSYGEWLESPYSRPTTGRTCQDCHTPAPTILNGNPLTNVAPGKGGVERDPLTIHAHTFPGASSQQLLQNSLTMHTTASRVGDKTLVEVSLINDQTGHHIPTDSPLRHLILVIEVKNEQGQPLPQIEGERLPRWAGVGDPQKGYYAGLPGKAFAKILAELWTDIEPSGAYWNPTRVVQDNRLAAFQTDTSRYVFSAPAQGEATVEVRLIYRRAFRSLVDQKGWHAPDIEMESVSLRVK